MTSMSSAELRLMRCLTKPQIGARWFIGPRILEWHLRALFDMLGVSAPAGHIDILASRRNRQALL